MGIEVQTRKTKDRLEKAIELLICIHGDALRELGGKQGAGLLPQVPLKAGSKGPHPGDPEEW